MAPIELICDLAYPLDLKALVIRLKRPVKADILKVAASRTWVGGACRRGWRGGRRICCSAIGLIGVDAGEFGTAL